MSAEESSETAAVAPAIEAAEELADMVEATSDERHAVLTGPLPLDWTRVKQQSQAAPVRYLWDVADFDTTEDELVIVGTAGEKITHMGHDFSEHCNPKLKRLVLRSHMIKSMEGLSKFEELELLELYDNMVEELQALDEGSNGSPGISLKVLDMSYNSIRDMIPVKLCPNLTELYLANNKLKKIEGIWGLKQLKKLDLGANRIRVMPAEELSGLVNLQELWLGKNKIEKIEGLEELTKLRRLDVQSNRLTCVEGLTTQKDTLEELYLAHNAITDEGACHLTGLGLTFTELGTLDLSRNVLTSTRPLAHLSSLTDLWLSGNNISSFEQIEPLTDNLTHLDTIYLEYNPLQQDFEYRKKVKELIPSLTQIDANQIAGVSFPCGGGQAETLEDQMRRLQDMAVQRAKGKGGG